MPCNACSVHSASGTGVNPFAAMLFISFIVLPIVNTCILIYLAWKVRRLEVGGRQCSRAT